MVSVSCYGRTGPLADRPGAGPDAEALGGLTNITREADGPPMLPSVPLGDSLVALSGVIGALVASFNTKVNGGNGQHVDVSMYEPVLALVQPSIVAWDRAGGEAPPHRTGSRVPNGVPRNVYRTRDDRWLVVSGTTDRQVARVLELIGHDDDEGRAKFARSADRLHNADELDRLVAAWIAQHDADEVEKALVARRVPVAPVHDLPGLVNDAHIAARHSLATVRDDTLGDVTMVAPYPKLSATPGEIRVPGPAVGEHNREVYGDWLGLAPGDVDALRAEGVI
jgi:crotonobetainyl-CoA:carnitine CoA-transferase CaiB-like acyl-CoA transferase